MTPLLLTYWQTTCIARGYHKYFLFQKRMEWIEEYIRVLRGNEDKICPRKIPCHFYQSVSRLVRGGGVEWAGLINIGLLVVEYHHLTICSPSVELISHKTLSSSLSCKISFHDVESRVKFNVLIKCLKGDILIQYGCHVCFSWCEFS